MEHRMKTRLTFAAATLVAMLSACGGGNIPDAASPQTSSAVPTDASQSVAGMTVYLTTLAGSKSETAEPVDLGAATLPTDNTIEPQAIN
jgi:ABC-type glycerol-3-phosphate transport system substrate-binding protein